MDHLDGFNKLADTIFINNFWHTGVKKNKPSFNNGSPYKEEDWDRYESFRDGKESGVTVLEKKADARFPFANEKGDSSSHDGLYILSPDQNLVDEADQTEDYNDSSFVILYRSAGGNIIIPGDAHDKTWSYVLENFEEDIKDCKFLLAPHHGRGSDRDYSFLDVMKPRLTLFGCASSDHLAYSAWNNRNLTFITKNQCGNVLLETNNPKLDVFIQNEKFAREVNSETYKHSSGYYYLCTID